MPRFKKRAVYVEAVQFKADDQFWPRGVTGRGTNYEYEGAEINDGDWIITGPEDERGVWSDEKFKAAFTRARKKPQPPVP